MIDWTQSFQITDTVNDVIYGINPAIEAWKDYGTSLTNLTQTNPAFQPSVVAGSPNVVRFDTNDYMDGVEPQAGDFTYEFDIDMTTALGLVARLLSDSASSTSTFFQKMSDNSFRLKSSTSANHNFPAYNITAGFKTLRLVKEGVELRLYENGVLVSTIATMTGSFNSADRLGHNSSSLQSDIANFKVYDSAINP